MMARSKYLAALVAIGTTLAAAGAADARRPRNGPERGVDSLNQPVVQRSDYVLELPAGGDGLAPAERGRLDAWFTSLGLGYGDRVFVEEAYGPSPARDAVARVAADYGILLSDGAPVTAGEIPQGGVRVIVSRSTATVPNCPNHGRSGGLNTTSSNYGCAVNSNLAAMVADPNDLVLGEAGSLRSDAITSNKAIRVYREAPPTGSKGLQDANTRGRSN